MDRTLVSMATVALLALVGCGDRVEVPVSEVAISDSAGVTIVDVGPLPGVAAPEWELERRFNTARTGVELFRVSSGRILADGRVVLGDAGNDELLLLESGGRLERRIGRSGDGPGEFRGIVSLHVAGDGFSVYDARLGRWTRFDRAGSVVSTDAMSPPDRIVDLRPLAVDPAGELLAVYGSMRRFGREGIRRDTTPLLRYNDLDRAPDTLGLWASEEWYYAPTPGGTARTYVGFGRSLAAYGRKDLAVLGDTDSLHISLFDARGEERMRIRGAGATIPATDEESERWRRRTGERLSASAPDEVRELFLQAPVHESYPAFDAAIVDAEGRVWVGATARLDAQERLWVVFDTEGSPAGRVMIPSSATVLDAAMGHVLLLESDDLNVQMVSLYAVGP